jgi:hypothetical protein
LALGACIEAFKVCWPVICIEDTFLTCKYKGTILTVVAADSNNPLLPLAIAFAEGRTVTVGTGSLRGWRTWWSRMCRMCVWYTIGTKVFCKQSMTWKREATSDTEFHCGQMLRAGGALGTWKQTSTVSSRTRPCLNCLSGCVSKLSRRSLMPSRRN